LIIVGDCFALVRNIEYLAWPSPLGEQGISNDEVIFLNPFSALGMARLCLEWAMGQA